jgi:hypothetical protein
MTDRFLGRWQLVPELSQYELGEPPQSGIYAVESSGGVLSVDIIWVDGKGQAGQTSYGGPMDGSLIELEAAASGSEADTHLTLTRIDGATLDSAVLLEGEVVAWARRIASADGELLSVVQAGSDPEGRPFRNFQVYRHLPSQ